MNREEISALIENIADRHIEEALEYEHSTSISNKKTWRKIAAAVAISVLGAAGIGTIAFAASEDFRHAVIRLVSHFSDNEKEDIRDGHMTTSLSKEDTLSEFLYQYQEEKNLLRYGENGFEYTFIGENGVDAKAIVSCENEGEYLFVELEASEIEPEVPVWKIKAYRIITSAQAEKLLSGDEKHDIANEDKWTEEDEKKAQDSTIRVTEKKGKIYAPANKDNVVTLTEEETDMLGSIFEQYKEDDDNAWWDHGGSSDDYVILLPEQDYMITKKGYVIRGEGTEAIAYILNAEDLKSVIKIFEKYKLI